MLAYTLSLIIFAIIGLVNRSHHAAINGSNMINSNPLTSHVLDTSRGIPASGLKSTLYKLGTDNTWVMLLERETNEDGRLSNLLSPAEFERGVYKFHFDTKGYYDRLGIKTFYPYVDIVFEIENPQEHYHVPLLLCPYGFSTYRGS